jgi:hypothetical protein
MSSHILTAAVAEAMMCDDELQVRTEYPRRSTCFVADLITNHTVITLRRFYGPVVAL